MNVGLRGAIYYKAIFLLMGMCCIIVVRASFPQGALRVSYKCGFWKGDPDFILVFNKNHTSIRHRVRYYQLLTLDGNDVKGALQALYE